MGSDETMAELIRRATIGAQHDLSPFSVPEQSGFPAWWLIPFKPEWVRAGEETRP